LSSGINGTVFALALDTNGNLYAGGSFTIAGAVGANRVARWDGTAWSALGSGMNDTVMVLLADGENLYAGGYFTVVGGGVSANRIAAWDGSSWSALGTGMNNAVFALAEDGGLLFAGGAFTAAGGSADHIASWDGASWAPLGAGIGGNVRALVAMGGIVCVGGVFTNAGGTAASGIAAWNGVSWSALGSGMNNAVRTLAVDIEGMVYAGGLFTTAGGTGANRIAQWDGATWHPLGSGMNSDVTALAIDYDSGSLYAGGSFTNAGGKSAYRAARAAYPAQFEILGTNGAAIPNFNPLPDKALGTDLGMAPVGQIVTRDFRVVNGGTAPLTISGVNLTGADAGDFAVFPYPSTIPGGGTGVVSIAFIPSVPGTRSAELVITHGGYPGRNPYEFAVQGRLGPLPDIKANGSDGPVTLPLGANLKVDVSLDAGPYAGGMVDCWLVGEIPTGAWYHYSQAGQWVKGWNVTYKGPIGDLASTTVSNQPVSGAGVYTLYFGVDSRMDGVIQTNLLFYDSVQIEVQP
jgi:hypothetical protein